MVFKAMSTQGSRVYSDRDALRWSLQIALALEYMHTREVGTACTACTAFAACE